MKKLTFGTPEPLTPSRFCAGFNPQDTPVRYDTAAFTFRETARGCVLEFPLTADEELYGFGLQLKEFTHKHRKLLLRTNSDPVAATGDSHAPVPFFVSTRGYGMYFDTARCVEVYCGFAKKQNRSPEADNSIIANADDLYRKTGLHEPVTMAVEIPSAKGIDVYLFEGNNILDVVSQYNMMAGGGCTVPDWGLATLYRAYAKYTDAEVLQLADYFEKNDLPVQTIGLEPGWQSSSYSCSYVWDAERYPNHDAMVAELRRHGYHINLWEHAFVNAVSPIYSEIFPYCGDYEVWKGIVPDFAVPEARRIFADYHRNTLTSRGIDGFKLDECDNSDFVHSDWSFPNCASFPSGLDGEQYHQLFGTLYMQTILRALDGQPTLSEVRNAGALAAPYPFVLYSDLYDHRDFIRGIVNSGFSGLLWTAELRDAASRKDLLRRLQTTVFSVQCLINAWYCPEVPWKEFDCESEVRELLRVRQSLIPMLRDAFADYHRTGKPPVRALVCDYTDDRETYAIDDEYIFCDRLIVAPLTAESDARRVYLPAGTWRDYWTKAPAASGWFDVCTEQIPVFERVAE